jgi:hypothetical protein
MIDRCAHLQNLREAILTYRRGLGQEVDEKHREATLQRGVAYLERYWTLCAFASYVQEPQWAAASESDGSFQLWMNRRPELQSVLRRMLWRSPMAALNTNLTPAASAALSAMSESDAAADAVVANRSGAVLGALCILKVCTCEKLRVLSLADAERRRSLIQARFLLQIHYSSLSLAAQESTSPRSPSSTQVHQTSGAPTPTRSTASQSPPSMVYELF